MNIDELIKIRQEFVDSQVKNNFDLSIVLAELYEDPSHFVYELIQNAEDAKATYIEFELLKEKVVIRHNGTPFNDKDIDAITSISSLQNEKKGNLEKIGKFGIGFKSVYNITNTPQIQSGLYDFKITNFVLPCEFSSDNEFALTTITLVFDKKDSDTDIYDVIKNKFENFEFFNLLFLRNIGSVKLSIDSNVRIFSREENFYDKDNVAVQSSIKDGGVNLIQEYLVFKNEVQNDAFKDLENKPNIAIAFMLDENKKIVHSDSSRLFAYFETSCESFLKFIIQAPFTTTPTRASIDFSKKINQSLLEEVVVLFKQALEFFADKKLLDVNLLELLPINTNVGKNEYVYWEMYKGLSTAFNEGMSLLPTLNNDYQNAQDVALVRSAGLADLLSENVDLQSLFNRKYWLVKEITEARTPFLWNYLNKELGIPIFTPDDFAKNFTTEFIENKDDDWVMSLYNFLNDNQEALWRAEPIYSVGEIKISMGAPGILRSKDIIRLEDGSHIPPVDNNDRIQVYLPTELSNERYKFVKKSLLSDSTKEFLNKLGVNEMNHIDEIERRIIPHYNKSNSNPTTEEHQAHFNEIITLYRNSSTQDKTKIIELIKQDDVRFFASVNKQDENSFRCYKNVYMNDELLENYFQYSPEVYFLDSGIYKDSDIETISFFEACGVQDYVWLREFEPNFDKDYKKTLRTNSGFNSSGNPQDHSLVDYKLEGLENFLSKSKMTIEESVLLWNIIIYSMSKETSKERFFKGKYEWFYRTLKEANFDSDLLIKLKVKKWLYSNSDTVPQLPEDVTITDLNTMYKCEDQEAHMLIEKLGLKKNIEELYLNQLSEEKRKKYELYEKLETISKETGISIEEFIQELENRNNNVKLIEIINAPEIDKLEVKEDVFVPQNDLNVRADVIVHEVTNDDYDYADDFQNEPNAENRNLIGRLGEEIVFKKFLKDKYTKDAVEVLVSEEEMEFVYKENKKIVIKWLNAGNNIGIGYDILIRENETDMEFIEVKSTKMQDRALFPINGYQWQLANKFHKDGKGEQYSIYVVRDVLSNPKVVRINNPAKLWLEGKIIAHPVNLKL